VNPARSTAAALFQGDWAISQLWMFWLMPIIGAVIGGLIYRGLEEKAA
ncbi:MAG TPA: aquaporin, partial [Pantoea agglomerans]|nr:aquaporin [Pantoea agglomerans]